jgi:hypothetical protein
MMKKDKLAMRAHYAKLRELRRRLAEGAPGDIPELAGNEVQKVGVLLIYLRVACLRMQLSCSVYGGGLLGGPGQ